MVAAMLLSHGAAAAMVAAAPLLQQQRQQPLGWSTGGKQWYGSGSFSRNKLTKPSCRRRVREYTRPPMAVIWPLELDTTTAATVVTGTSLLGFAIVRTFVYFRMQYIIAAMLGRHVPRGGSRILDLGIREGRNLYYYPKDVIQVVVVAPSPNLQLLESQAVRAGVPIEVKSKSPDASGLPANSMDAVVSVYAMSELSDSQVASSLSEAVRVLKPGKPFIFVENVGAKATVLRAAQGALETIGRMMGNKTCATRDLLPFLEKMEGLTDLQYDNLLDFQDPHLVGVAIKKPAVSASESSDARDKLTKKKRKSQPAVNTA
ncbi:unnamed protein product [Sphagnum jensenii]|uniref:Methyltransferase domain-containing protein n=1 Tax=Sphagnum jensenii TaxID=128206 RepID=A0ABP0WKY3_9BRYO